MLVVSKSRGAIVNMNNIACMYIGERTTIKVSYVQGSGCQVASYNTQEEAEEALKMLAESIGKAEVFFFPEDEVVRARIGLRDQKYHHATGKKTKGHGGS